MRKYSGIELVKKLCEIYGPTGFEYKVAEFIKEQTEGLCEYVPDRMGNLVCVVKGSGEGYDAQSPTKIMISAHMDEVGFIIKGINDDGSIKFILDGGIDAKVLSSVEMNTFADFYTQRDADRYLSEGKVVIFGGGLGAPYFSTDTPAVVRAAEIGADVVLMAKNVDGLYTADPKKDPTATRYDDVTYAEILEKDLKAFDLTAVSFCNENNIDCYAFALSDPDNIYNAVMGNATGTKMHK